MIYDYKLYIFDSAKETAFCTSKNVDLLPFTKLESIGYNFLELCSKLKTINFSSFSNIKSVGNTNTFTVNQTNH